MNRLPIRALALLLLLCPAWPAFGTAADLQTDAETTTGGDTMGGVEGPVTLETFTAPQPIEMAQPEVPAQYLRRGREGWVHLNFMVGTDGKPFEVTVADAVGDAEFQRAAVDALQRSRFEPAKLGGVPIESGMNFSFVFETEGDGVGRRFGRRYRQLIDAVQAGDREAADAALGELDADNLYENAYLEFARFARHSRWGSTHQQLDALQRAVGWDRRTSYLPDDLLQDALRNLFTLQLQMQDFGGALNTAGRLRELPLEQEFAVKLEATVREMEAFRHDDVTIAVEGLIDDASYSWHLNLFSNAFYIDRVEGRLAEIKLRCAEEFVGFAFDAGLVYRIAQQHMPCSLEAIGDPGTRFRVVQSRAAAGG